MANLTVEHLSKSFPTSDGMVPVLLGVSFRVPEGEIVGIRGENGSGKTTLFNIIAGIEKADSGNISLDGIAGNRIRLGVVFQNYSASMLPWLTVSENICVPLKILGYGAKEVNNRVAILISQLGFGDLPMEAFPHQLSGGQKQKVAVCRAIINDPDILILDEPFSNLDFQTSLELQNALQKIHTDRGIPMLLVSHNIDQVMYLADKVVVLGGRPSTVIKEFVINLERPRKPEALVSREFEDLRNTILEFEYGAFQRPLD